LFACALQIPAFIHRVKSNLGSVTLAATLIEKYGTGSVCRDGSVASLVSGYPANDLVTFLLGPNAVARSLERDRFPAILTVWNAGFMICNLFHNEYGLLMRLNRLPTNGTRDHFHCLPEPVPEIRMLVKRY
jgi:hypothetical protein